jgi:hypothetical protein
MSTTQISFKAKLKIGEQIIPLASELVSGDAESQDGVQNGFLFKLDLAPNDPAVAVNLGDVIAFIESKLGLGAGSLAKDPRVDLLSSAFPALINKSNFTSGNSVIVLIKAFEVNSTTKEFLFSISVDIDVSDPNQFNPLPADMASWMSVNSLAVSFTATKSA